VRRQLRFRNFVGSEPGSLLLFVSCVPYFDSRHGMTTRCA